MNLYVFVGNDGTNKFDMLGLFDSMYNRARERGEEICKEMGDGWTMRSNTTAGHEIETSEWEMVNANPLRAGIILSFFYSTPEDVFEGLSDAVLSVIFWKRERSLKFSGLCECKDQTAPYEGEYTAVNRKRTIGHIVYSDGSGGA